MKKLRTSLTALCLIIGFAVAVISAVNIQEGSWEMTMKTEMKGMPFKMPDVKYTVCLTKDNVNPQNKDKDCTLISSKTVGSTYSWVIECNTKNGVVKSNGSVTYSGSTMNGIINATTSGMAMTQKMSGRRLGPCAK